MGQEGQNKHSDIENEMRRLGFKNFDLKSNLQIRKKINMRYKQKRKQE
jgi:hypothetical protein